MAIFLQCMVTICIQFLIGFGFLRQFKISLSKTQIASLSILCGLAVSTVILFFMGVVHIPIRFLHFTLTSIAVAVGMNWNFKSGLSDLKALITFRKLRLPPYEFVTLVIVVYLVFISVWRCFYLPVSPRDAIVGFDLVAKAAVEEQRIDSSLFEAPYLEGKLSNQPFYAPFTAFMQIIFRMTGLAFGKVWLSFVFISFLLFFYSRLKTEIHPILAGWMLILVIAVPEFYAFSFMVLTDFATVVFFVVSVILFYEFIRNGNRSLLLLSSFFMAFACWSRADTIIFAFFGSILLFLLRRKEGTGKALLETAFFMSIPLLAFILWNGVYAPFFLGYAPKNQIHEGLFQLSRLSRVLQEISTKLLFNTYIYGYSIFIFLGLTLINLIVFRDRKGYEIGLWILLCFAVFVIIGHVFTAATVQNTIKRSFLRLFPLMYFYLSRTELMQALTRGIQKVEALPVVSSN